MGSSPSASTRPGPFTSAWSPLWIGAAVLLIALGLVRGIHYTGGVHTSIVFQRDYDNIYAGGWCLLHRCDPYSVPTLDRVLREHGDVVDESRWILQLPIYPPTTLLLMSPLSALPYGPSITVWALLNRGMWIFGLLWAFLWSRALRDRPLILRIAAVVFFLGSLVINHGLMFGNPAYAVAGILLFVTLDDADRRWLLHALLLTVAILLKPQIALPFAALVFFRGGRGRQTVAATLALLAVFTTVTLAYVAASPATAHWREGLAANLRLGQSAGVSMNPSLHTAAAAADPMLHLQYLVGYWIADARQSSAISLAGVALFALLIAWPLLHRRRRNPGVGIFSAQPPAWGDELYLTGVAAVSAWMFLPVYHRWSDLCMLAPILVWAIRSLPIGRLQLRAVVAVAAILILGWMTITAKVVPGSGSGAVHALRSLIFYRGDPLLILLLAAIATSALWTLARTPDHQPL